MKQTRIIMGMPVTVEIPLIIMDGENSSVNKETSTKIAQETNTVIKNVFDYFDYVDKTFSTYKTDSEIMRINRDELKLECASEDMQEIFRLSAQTRNETDGFFDIVDRTGKFDPSGIVKGWAIWNAAKLIDKSGFANYYVEAGGDIQVHGKNGEGKKWSIGIKNPFKQEEIIKIVYLEDQGIATSGTYIRGQHIYNPRNKEENITDIVSLSVIGPNIYEADRFATAAFAMGRDGIMFIEKLNGFEGYLIDSRGKATMTSDFEKFTVEG